MNEEQIKKRSHVIKGSKKKLYPLPVKAGRRGINHIDNPEELEELKYDSFFEFEKDLSDMESAREQALRAHIDSGGHYVPGDFEGKEVVAATKQQRDEGSGIIMEEIDEESISPIIMEDDKIGTEFKQCEFIKANGKRCKRQAPKHSKLCAAHRKS